MKNKIALALLIFVVVTLVMANAKAMGIVGDYLKDDNLIVPEGTNAEYGLRLQNMGDEDIAVNMLVTSDDNIASIKDEKEIYVLKSKTTNTEVLIHLETKEAKKGEEFEVVYTINQGTNEEGMISIGGAIQGKFIVVIGQKPEEKIGFIPIAIGVGTITLIGGITIWLRKKRVKKEIKEEPIIEQKKPEEINLT